MNTHFYLPEQELLQTFVHCIWQTEGKTAFQQEIIIPKGITEIIFDFGSSEPIAAVINNKNYTLGKCIINGFNTFPIQMHLPQFHTHFGIQFHPVAIKSIFGVPAREFSNLPLDLTLIDPFFETLRHQLGEQPSFTARIEVISNWLSRKTFSLPPQERLLNAFLGERLSENRNVSAVADRLCYSPRHLSRKIQEISNMNTEEMLLYKKYLHAVDLLHSSHLSLTQIAYQSGFVDQSHFIRSFRLFTQMTPGEYRQQKSHLPGHFYANVR